VRNRQGFEFTDHPREMLKELDNQEELVCLTIDKPDKTEIGKDENTHYYKAIEEMKNRILHIVVNNNVSPKKLITVFFDRRARR
jgi:hypothetical protein